MEIGDVKKPIFSVDQKIALKKLEKEGIIDFGLIEMELEKVESLYKIEENFEQLIKLKLKKIKFMQKKDMKEKPDDKYLEGYYDGLGESLRDLLFQLTNEGGLLFVDEIFEQYPDNTKRWEEERKNGADGTYTGDLIAQEEKEKK